MARYTKVFPMVDSQANSFAKIQQLMQSKGYKYLNYNGEQIFQKGDGFWVLAKCAKVTYFNNFVRLEAWVVNTGAELDLEGFVGAAGKKPLKKVVAEMETILQTPGVGYVPEAQPEAPAADAPATYCANCGAVIAPGGVFCPGCGLGVGEKTKVDPVLPEGITKREYYKNYADDSFKRQLKGSAILCYIVAGVTALMAVLINPLSLLDAIIVLGLGLGMHLGRSKVCAYIILIYSILSTLITLISTGTFGGWLLILAGVYAVITFSKGDKRFKELTGQ